MKRVAYFGTPRLAASILEGLLAHPDVVVPLVVTQPDVARGRGRKISPCEVKVVAEEHGIAVLQPLRLKRSAPSFLEEAAQHGPFDGAVVAAYGQILPTSVLEFFSRKCINVHASILPKYRGAAPIQRAIMGGESSSGVCLMQMEEGLDTGPVYVSATCPILPTTTAGELADEIARLGAALLESHLVAILNGECEGTEQDHSTATLAPKISKSECAIGWDRPAPVIAQHINGVTPAPGAHTFLRSTRIKLCGARADEVSPDALSHPETMQPGMICALHKTSIEVAASSGSVYLDMIQMPGKTMRPWREVRAGSPLKLGDLFTQEASP